MRQKIATLEVWIDDQEGADSRLLARSDIGEYRMVIAPNQDEQSKDPENLPTILAHELGHFMGHVLRDKEHTLTSLMSPEVNWRKSIGIWDKESEKEWIRTVQIPTEVQAWKYADMIYPGVKC